MTMKKLPASLRVTGADVNRVVEELLREMQIICGPGLELRKASGGRVISLVKNPLDLAHAAVESSAEPGGQTGEDLWFVAKITGATAGNPNQWSYSWTRQKLTTSGYTGWTDDEQTGNANAYNLSEVMNDGAGLEGNGVDIDGADFPAGFELMPVPVGAFVWMRAVKGALTEYWFQYENGIDGECG